ncbi:MAG: quinone-dependent dihydroorotate dehydrogenase [Chloroflexi bacterium]|nr:quinone-dependent dihydroorotate dehydrogenase [Chloroflexota bacterium]MDL1942309.1 quinone-dependent dihydroorotate dehydrogenase [Chloroflexi bacterium CFX2]
MYNLLRPLLFRLEPERAHALTLNALRLAGYVPPARWLLSLLYYARPKPVKAFGLTFKNPVGLAAGYDKDGVAVRGLAALGFGHVEVGTVTPLAQEGSPKPRVFRLPEDEAVINRMGFPGKGAAYVERQLRAYRAREENSPAVRWLARRSTILGVNLGRNKSTPNEEAVLDYLALVQNFSPYADYLTINVSSPNTVGLRQLQGRAALEGLLFQIHAQRKLEEESLQKRLPVLVKLAPDLMDSELDDAIEVILHAMMDGIIVTNTTLAREGLRSGSRGESGGLSGAPLRVRSEAVLRQTVKRVNGKIPVVSAGGIMNPDDAKRRLDAGAALVQVYTGLIYRGPALVKEIVKSL